VRLYRGKGREEGEPSEGLPFQRKESQIWKGNLSGVASEVMYYEKAGLGILE